MTPFEIIDNMHHGKWDNPFPDDLQYEIFVGFLHESQQAGAESFLVKYTFNDDGDNWAAWQEFTFIDDGRCQAEALYLPSEEAVDKLKIPEGLEDVPVFDYQWPDNVDWSMDDLDGSE
jgi:hypothetical protein